MGRQLGKRGKGQEGLLHPHRGTTCRGVKAGWGAALRFPAAGGWVSTNLVPEPAIARKVLSALEMLKPGPGLLAL